MTRFRVAISVVAFCLATLPAFPQDATKPADPDPAKTPAMKADVDKVVADINAGALTGVLQRAVSAQEMIDFESGCLIVRQVLPRFRARRWRFRVFFRRAIGLHFLPFRW